MARIESVAVAGYYKTPTPLLEGIAGHLQGPDDNLCIIDPCAGEGEALAYLARRLGSRTVAACELEGVRYRTMEKTLQGFNAKTLHGDAFCIEFAPEVADILYLNPPYDTDPIHGRVEEKFLERFTTCLAEDGVLVFVVPYYALKASAQTLARHYNRIACYRFPQEDFEAYSQVVLYAHRDDSKIEPDSDVMGQVMAWGQSPEGIPVLGSDNFKATSGGSGRYFSTWKLNAIDLKALAAKAKVWKRTTKFGQLAAVPHILPEIPVQELMFRSYPLATPPRPAHIASGIASGLFNGREVQPATPGLPSLLVKGSFDREYRTIEAKRNKKEEVTSVVQIQQPKLVTTVLDLESYQYHTLKSTGKSTDPTLESLSVEDLIEHYGPGLMSILEQQCPVLYDPRKDEDSVPLPNVNRNLYRAQSHAAKAVLKLLGGHNAKPRDRQRRSAILLGEIGSGKSTVALTVGKAIGKRMLVMCPPHLLDSWLNEAKAVTPEAEVHVLKDITDIEALSKVPADQPVVAVLSREAAKLGHGWTGVMKACPSCGAGVPIGDLAKKRARCGNQTLLISNQKVGRLASELALKLAPFAPKNPTVKSLLRSRHLSAYLETIEPRPAEEWRMDTDWTSKAMDALRDVSEAQEAFFKVAVASHDTKEIFLHASKLVSESDYHNTQLAQHLAAILPLESKEQLAILKAIQSKSVWYGSAHFVDNLKAYGLRVAGGALRSTGDAITFDEIPLGTLKLALKALASLVKLAGVTLSTEVCGEPLFQASPSPRRVALSRYICQRYPNLFDFFVLDEGHEYATEGSAQEKAARRIMALGLPTVIMTGSIMNGYAASLFTTMWAVSPDFRAEFSRDEHQRFIDRYGYRKRVLTDKDLETGDVVEFGAVTDRVTRSVRIVGDAPGVLPLFLFRHLLRFSVTLHKADLAVDIPKCQQIRCGIEPDPALKNAFNTLKERLLSQIKKDRFKPEFAGKLFGALAELPSYLDRASLGTGNQDNGTYEVRYPQSLGGDVVATGEAFEASHISAKEQWMLDTIRQELDEGRRVMVFAWHTSLLPRLSRLIEEATGEKAPILYANKVATGKRQAWIDKNIIQKGRKVMVANPVSIQTGLNNLVHFSSEIWMENPACNPSIFRQATGRVDRIGQLLETRIYLPVYVGTLQETLLDLLLQKVAVAVSTDGLDPESALAAAGIQEDNFVSGLSIGKQLWAILNGEAFEEAA